MSDRNSIRYAAIPVDGTEHEIESRSLTVELVERQDTQPCHPQPPQRVRAVDDRYAVDDVGWVYYRYDYPYGWTHSGHVADYVVHAFQLLAGSYDRWTAEDLVHARARYYSRVIVGRP